MFSSNPVFDSSTKADVTAFSIALTALIQSHPGLSANVLYVILSFHAAQQMTAITRDATERVATRESEVDDMLREDMKRTGELPE